MIHLPYGANNGIDLEIDESRVQGVFRAPAASPDLANLIETALANPLDFPPLDQSVIPDDHVCLVLDGKLPQGSTILAALWPRLAARGVAPENVAILQAADPASGPPDDPRSDLPEEIRDCVTWKIHEPSAEEDGTLHYLATTAGGERIYLAEELVFADVVVAIGRIGFDPLLGFRGTHSAFFPDFSSAEAVRRTQGQGHSELAPENERPLRQLVDEIGWLLGAAYTIQAIPGRQSGISEILTGASESVLRRGCELLVNHWRVETAERAETVIIAVDHNAAGNGWSRVAAALALAQRLVERDGRIIVLSELSELPGDGLDMLRRVEEPNDVVRPLRDAMPADLIAATQFASAVDWARVYLLSRLDGDLVEELFCVPVENDQEIIRLLGNTDDSCLFIESAQYADGRVE